ncbi:hypothetical protein R1sor_027450 [Riccia sorocarpa]|uniref:Kinesin-like protein n=1 Tax=Riccia sorocarpa TaxID=122646 RepID=A0ABD3GFZ6_9MARC
MLRQVVNHHPFGGTAQSNSMPPVSRSAFPSKAVENLQRTPRFSLGGVGKGANPMQSIQEERPMTRSQSKVRERYAPFAQGAISSKLHLESTMKSSHPSVSLLTPRIKQHHQQQQQSSQDGHQQLQQTLLKTLRRTSMSEQRKDLTVAEDHARPAPMEVDLVTPRVNHLSSTFMALYNGAKETEKRVKDGVNAETARPRGPPHASSMKTTTTTLKSEQMSVMKSGLKTAGLRARQVHEDMERGGGEEDGGGGTRIMVYVRLRPMSKKEKEAGARSCVKIVNNRDVYLTEMALETDYLRLKRLRGRHFAFDAAFPDNTSQEEVYQTSAADLVEGVLEGRNTSVFCYGATGAGKTHTMLGTVQQPGVMVLALKDLFTKLKQRSPEGEHVVRLSYLEVYNETVRDLLSPGRPLVLREDSRQGITAAGLTQYQAFSADEVIELLHKGNTNRQTEPTRCNETSSRSHAILQVLVEYSVQQEIGKVLRVGKLSLIDLAGSERALATEQRTLRSVEGANINRSLLALSSCINALVEGKKHIPFRNSKLTQLLKDSLGGPCSTAMIANVSPSNISFGETQNTLHWAARAKEIKTKGNEVNEELMQVPEDEEEKSRLVMQMQKENQMLRLQIARLERSVLANQNMTTAATPAAVGSTPFTPAVPSGRNSLDPGTATAVETFARRGEYKTMAEKKIWELQRTVELLEMEAEKTRRDGALREEKMNASLMALTAEHSLQLKRKDEFIRNLCTTMNMVESPAVEKVIPSPIKCLENILSQRAMAKENVKAEKAVTAVAEKGRTYVTPKGSVKTGSRTSSCVRTGTSTVAKVDPKLSGVTTRRMKRNAQQTPASPGSNLPKTPVVPRFFSPSKAEEQFASCKKRTFWDITNSPNSHLRSPGLYTGRTSLLRQPGFARRKTSPEFDP